METGLTKNKILSELSRSPHGKLVEYKDVTLQAAKTEPEFLAHLIAWNEIKGQIRDSKIAIPILSLMHPMDEEFVENSLAHIAKLGPRQLLQGFNFVAEINQDRHSGLTRKMQKLISAWLQEKEAEANWDRLAIQHRGTLKTLYSLTHTKPKSDRVNIILFGRDLAKNKMPQPKGSIFEAAFMLSKMSDAEAAGAIFNFKIPFLIAQGALKDRIKKPDLFLALLSMMSPTELITNAPWMIEEYNLKNNLAVKGAFEAAMKKAQTSTKNVLKTTRAAESITDETLKSNLRGLQEKQLSSLGVEGNWLVLGDKSGSMAQTIEIARQVAATLAKMVKGKVTLTFFDTMPHSFDVTGKPLDTINKETRFVEAGGGTSIGCGLQRLFELKQEVDGIVVVSDAQENSTPYFAAVYKNYSAMVGKEVPVYLYRTTNLSNFWQDKDLVATMKQAGFDIQEFDLTGRVDYYALPNMVQTMRTNRYSLIDEVMASKLLTVKDVLKNTNFGRKEVRVNA